MEDCPDRTPEMASPIVVGHGRARLGTGTGERNTADHTAGKVGARGRGDVDDVVVNIAAHDVDVTVGFEALPVSIGTARGRL